MPTNSATDTHIRSNPSTGACEVGQADVDVIFSECARLRKNAGLTQEEVARRMGTTASAVARMESCGSGKKFSPRLNTLRRYAQALGFRLVFRLERDESSLDLEKDGI